MKREPKRGIKVVLITTFKRILSTSVAKIRTKMIAYKLSLVVVLAFLGAANAQVLSGGPCPQNITVMDNFTVEDYLGRWYEHSVYPKWFERNGKCVSAEYTLKLDGNVGIFNQLINKKTLEKKTNEGTGVVVDTDGKLAVEFGQPPYSSIRNYWVLDTDYKSYSVVYSCQTVHKYFHLTFVWVMTRKMHPCDHTIATAQQAVSDAGFAVNELVMTEQSDC